MGNGQAFVFVFPFGVFRATEEIHPRFISEDGASVRLYPPHVNGDEFSSVREVNLAQVPWPPGQGTPTNIPPGLSIRYLQPGQATQWVVASAMRVDVYGNLDQKGLAEVADRVVKRFLRNCRLWLRQWWITRGDNDDDGNRQLSFAVDENGHPVALQSFSLASSRPLLKTERLLSSSSFGLLIHVMRAGLDAPLSGSSLLDSVYHSIMGELPRAVLDLAIACEALLREEAYRNAATDDDTEEYIRRTLTNQPWKKCNIKNATRLAFGTPLTRGSEIAQGLARLQEVRNALAHGNPRQLERTPEIRERSAYRVIERAAFGLFNWAATVRPQPFPDPILAFQIPMERETGDESSTS